MSVVELELDGRCLTSALIVTIVLYLKFIFSTYVSEKVNDIAKQKAAVYEGKSPEADLLNQVYQEVALRSTRIVANDLEQIPLGLFFAWVSIPVAYSPLAHTVFVISFGSFRVLHTIFFILKVQPYRTYAWTLGVLSVVGMIINTFIGCAFI
eukprot:c8614_g1_i1.p1 GENE.c8614_g1_i1~~c8614_g1_i1.p1  ORF type:complete len:160 (+),score=30.14 c8614_g1_i1:25-480(+)